MQPYRGYYSIAAPFCQVNIEDYLGSDRYMVTHLG